MTDLVSYAFADGVATLTMDDGKANAMGPAMQASLNAALDRAEADKAIVVLTGRAGVFSGGFDLGVFKAGDAAVTFQMLTGGAQLAQRLLAYPHPVVAVEIGQGARGALVGRRGLRVHPAQPRQRHGDEHAHNRGYEQVEDHQQHAAEVAHRKAPRTDPVELVFGSNFG